METWRVGAGAITMLAVSLVGIALAANFRGIVALVDLGYRLITGQEIDTVK